MTQHLQRCHRSEYESLQPVWKHLQLQFEGYHKPTCPTARPLSMTSVSTSAQYCAKLLDSGLHQAARMVHCSIRSLNLALNWCQDRRRMPGPKPPARPPSAVPLPDTFRVPESPKPNTVHAEAPGSRKKRKALVPPSLCTCDICLICTVHCPA